MAEEAAAHVPLQEDNGNGTTTEEELVCLCQDNAEAQAWEADFLHVWSRLRDEEYGESKFKHYYPHAD